MKKIGIVVDSSSGFSKKFADANGVYFVPLIVNFDGTDYLDGVDLDDEIFSTKLTSAKKTSTASHTMEAVFSVWDKALKECEKLVHIPLSNSLSVTNSLVVKWSKEPKYNGKVITLENSKFMSPWISYWIKDIVAYANKAKSAEDVLKALQKANEDMWGYISPKTLSYLARGGRISKFSALVGNALKILPIVTYKNGNLTDAEVIKIRGSYEKAASTIINMVKDDYIELKEKGYKPAFFFRGSNENLEIVKMKISVILGIEEKDIIFTNFGNVILSHIGPDAFGGGNLRPFEAYIKEAESNK